MFPMVNIGRTLLLIGGIIAFSGVIIIVLGRFGLGRLPGDILISRENLTVFLPITTMIVISIVLTIIFNLIRRF